jgi:serine/threonine-protein kinase
LPGTGDSGTPRTGWSTTVTGTEEGRAFFQHRLSVVGLCLLVLVGGSWLVFAIAYPLLPDDGGPGDYNPLAQGGPFHLAGGILAGALWLITRRGRRSGPLLHVLDITVTLALLASFVAGAVFTNDPQQAISLVLMCFNMNMLARAIVVPSTPRRTLVLGLVAAAPVVLFVVWRGGPILGHAAAAISAICWAAVGIGLGTVASQTIFGLRREVQQARVLGQYTLEAKIGEGGMGEVWRASHALLRRPTAIKLLPPGRTGEAAIRRFEREVQLTARLTHPSTVAIYDYGRTREGVFYYAMELLEGTDLEHLVAEDGPQPAARVVHILGQVCGALAEAHDLSLVHRDMKPANVLLLPRREEHELAKVVDFGLVKEVKNDDSQVNLTAANTITGTPLYMAPEAIKQPDSVDTSSDLYALGAVGWFLLVGRPPFEARTVVEVLSQHLHTRPARPSVALGKAVPTDLEEILLACLEKEPGQRPRSARDLRSAFEACSVAGAWTSARAAAWWQRHARVTPAIPANGHGQRTIALDVAGR